MPHAARDTSRTSRDKGCAFSAALGAAEHGMAWAMALALFKRALEERVSASGRSGGSHNGNLPLPCGILARYVRRSCGQCHPQGSWQGSGSTLAKIFIFEPWLAIETASISLYPAEVDFLKCSRHLWEDGPHEAVDFMDFALQC